MQIPRVIGHRGAAARAPENTLASFREAARLGARWVELDAKLTGDDQVICLHDAAVDRTTDGRGRAAEMSLDEIRRLDAGRWLSPDFAGERVPTLAEALALIADLNMGVNVEIKPCKGREIATAEATVALVGAVWPAGRPLLYSSFKPECLEVARRVAPDAPRGYLVDRLEPGWQTAARALGAATINLSWKSLDEGAVRAVREAGYDCLAYTVNDRAVAERLWGWGCAAVFSDLPEAFGPVPAG